MTIEFNGGTLEVHKRVRRDFSYRGWREFELEPRMYVTIKDETILDNLVNRTRRPYNVYKTLIHSSNLGEFIDLSKLTWSQRAGCTMCPCSPGFILNRQPMAIGDDDQECYNFDLWLTLTGDIDHINHAKPPRVLAMV
jgi:hypothetical protein